MSQTYGTNYTTAQKLVNWTIKLTRLLKKLQKNIYQDQDVEDGLQPNYYHCVEIHQSTAQFGLILHEIGNWVHGCRWTWRPLGGT